MHFPWAFLSPASTVSQWEESTMTAALATAGSLAAWRRNFSISARESSIASSMFTSITEAPLSSCDDATARAWA